jgi:serine/threonine protein kinase
MVADPANRVSDLFHQAAELPVSERSSFLEAACNGNEKLRQEVESLLRYDSSSPEFLETPLAADASGAVRSENAIAPGHQLGAYTIGEPLGVGGMGEVYRAFDRKLGREVAIKILPAPFTRDPERRARFAREARLLATLSHPHIGAIYGVEEADDTTALILELVEGPSLSDCLARGPLPIPRAIGVAREVAEALDAAHEKAIVHRDLKPSNIVLRGGAGSACRDGCVKVLDFGLAKSMQPDPGTNATLSPTGSRDVTIEGRILGTPAYMSPEQARGLFVDKRTDIWAFGCVLFQMLSGRKPFEGKTDTDTFARILEHEPDWPALPPTTPASVRRLLLRCLEKDIARRLRDIGDAATYFEERPAIETPDRRTRHAWRRLIAAAALLIGTFVVARTFWPAPPGGTVHRSIMLLDVDLGSDVSLGSELDAVSGFDHFVGISPDAERLVFISAGRLVTRRLNDATSVTLPGTEGTSAFFFSPDSKSVGFVVDGKLKRLSLDGGTIATITDNPLPVRGGVFGSVRGGTWAGETLVLGSAGTGLLRVPANGGTPEPLTRLGPGEFTHRWPQFLPGGKALLFTSHIYPEWFDLARVEALSLADGRRKKLLDGASFARFVGDSDASGYLTFVRAGTLFAVPFDPVGLNLLGSPVPILENLAYDATFGSAQIDASATGTMVYRRGDDRTLVWLDSSGATRPLSFQPGRSSKPHLSDDGNHIAFVSEGDLWVYDFSRDVRTQMTRQPAVTGPALWTPDGRFIIFSTPDNIWSVRSDGGAPPRRLLSPKSSGMRVAASIHVAGDAGRLAFEEITFGGSDGWDLWTVPIRIDSGGPHALEPEVFLKTRYDERDLRFSPNFDWVAYSSDESGGRQEIYVRAFPDDGRRWKLTEGGGTYPVWSQSRPELFFRTGRIIMLVPYSTSNGNSAAAKPRPSSSHPVDPAAIVPFSVSPDGLHVVAHVSDLAADRQSRHVATLWINAVDEFRRRAPAGGPH